MIPPAAAISRTSNSTFNPVPNTDVNFDFVSKLKEAPLIIPGPPPPPTNIEINSIDRYSVNKSYLIHRVQACLMLQK